MPTSLSSGGRSPTPNKEDGSDAIPSLRGDDREHIHPIDPKVLRRATLKTDLYLIPIVGMFYLLSFLDRSNIGNARVAGLTKSLHMTTNQFSTALTITYVPYILMELPMNLLMKRLGANVTLPIMVVLWGMVCACQGAVHSYHGLLVCRFFLGALEGGLFPGIVLLLSTFYKRHAMQVRFAMMFSVTSLAGAFSGILAFGIQNLHGKRGIAGWQWIFILEGVFTVVFGLVTCFLVPASPRNIKFLTEEEREAYCRDLADDWSGDADTDGKYDEVFRWSEVASAFTDAPHVLMLALPLFFSGVTLFGLANFTPTIVSALGHSPNRTQLLTVPPYACSFVFSIVSAYLCDKYKNRGVMATFCALLAAAGYAIFLGSKDKNTDYGALYLQIIGSYAIAPCLSTWNANNVQPHYRRATAVAIAFVATNIGGIVSTWLFTDLRGSIKQPALTWHSRSAWQ
ncbi:MFS general substrate transporter [Multifurca ochricompacta]|uniref:MFS general substrate transporter n=1 Tax=Multifurca ochricompacta TaxID=376703 RepID=A0AAD4QN15_9AGAM|nr:MFS general substrate transporter [Multifurca ochricompacta]